MITMTDNLTLSMALPQIDFWNKYNLTIEEASAYFGIGENKFRKIVDENPTEQFILKNGCKTLIKKDLFGQYINRQNTI